MIPGILAFFTLHLRISSYVAAAFSSIATLLKFSENFRSALYIHLSLRSKFTVSLAAGFTGDDSEFSTTVASFV